MNYSGYKINFYLHKVMEHAGFPNSLGDLLEDTIANIKSGKAS